MRLTAFFQSYIPSSSFTRRNYKSLSQQEVKQLSELIHPESVHNPFAPEHRIRNYLIVKIFLSTGIRLGELLLLRTTSMAQEDANFYMSIAASLNPEDTRADLPDLKNSHSERIVAISEQLYVLSNHYILHLRRPVRKGKPMNLAHGFLFTSELGKPLSKGAVADMFRKINSTLHILNQPPSVRISPYVMRHTFADNFLQYLIEVRHLDMARAKDELRAVCGWTIDSPMPLHYAGRYISNIANQHNLDRITTTDIFYEQRPGSNSK
jgi:integrase